MGTMPAATAAAEPPLDPLVERPRSHGLRVGPNNTPSHDGDIPNSGVADFPMITSPACSNRRTISDVEVDTFPARKRDPSVNRTPSTSATRSLRTIGTPGNGPPVGTGSGRARSNIGVTT